MSSIQILDFRTKNLTKFGYQKLLPRASVDINSALKIVEPILEEVRQGDESTLISLSKKYDGIAPRQLLVPRAELKNSLKELDPKVRKALEISISRVRKVHKKQTRINSKTNVVPGGTIHQKWIGRAHV